MTIDVEREHDLKPVWSMNVLCLLTWYCVGHQSSEVAADRGSGEAAQVPLVNRLPAERGQRRAEAEKCD